MRALVRRTSGRIGIWEKLLIVGICGVGALFVWALRGHLYSYGFGKMSAAEIQRYEKWVDAPLDLPSESLKPPPYPPESHLKQKAEMHAEVRVAGYEFRKELGLDDAADVWELWEDMSTTQAAALADELEPVMERIREVVTHPDYSTTSRTAWIGTNLMIGMDDAEALTSLCSAFVFLKLKSDEIDSASRAFETSLLTLKTDPYVGNGLRNNLTIAYFNATKCALQATAYSDDVKLLRKFLSLMNEHRDLLFQDNAEAVFLGHEIALYVQMMAAEYADSDKPLTPRKVIGADTFEKVDFLRTMARQADPDDALRRTIAKETMWVNRAESNWLRDAFAKVAVFGIEVAIHSATAGVDPAALPLRYQVRKYRTEVSIHALLQYDAARFKLARHIARLEEKPLPATAEDFVPEYLPEFPRDPYSGQPIQFSAEQQSYYSVGPDGVQGTKDDMSISLAGEDLPE